MINFSFIKVDKQDEIGNNVADCIDYVEYLKQYESNNLQTCKENRLTTTLSTFDVEHCSLFWVDMFEIFNFNMLKHKVTEKELKLIKQRLKMFINEFREVYLETFGWSEHIKKDFVSKIRYYIEFANFMKGVSFEKHSLIFVPVHEIKSN